MGEQDARVWRGEHCWASRGRPGFRGSYWVARPEFLTMGVDVVEPIHHARRWKLRDVPPEFPDDLIDKNPENRTPADRIVTVVTTPEQASHLPPPR